MVGTTRSRVNFFMNKFRRLGFIEYNGGLKINNSLLSVVLRTDRSSPELRVARRHAHRRCASPGQRGPAIADTFIAPPTIAASGPGAGRSRDGRQRREQQADEEDSQTHVLASLHDQRVDAGPAIERPSGVLVARARPGGLRGQNGAQTGPTGPWGRRQRLQTPPGTR